MHKTVIYVVPYNINQLRHKINNKINIKFHDITRDSMKIINIDFFCAFSLKIIIELAILYNPKNGN